MNALQDIRCPKKVKGAHRQAIKTFFEVMIVFHHLKILF